jgi:hypothetical protein
VGDPIVGTRLEKKPLNKCVPAPRDLRQRRAVAAHSTEPRGGWAHRGQLYGKLIFAIVLTSGTTIALEKSNIFPSISKANKQFVNNVEAADQAFVRAPLLALPLSRCLVEGVVHKPDVPQRRSYWCWHQPWRGGERVSGGRCTLARPLARRGCVAEAEDKGGTRGLCEAPNTHSPHLSRAVSHGAGSVRGWAARRTTCRRCRRPRRSSRSRSWRP